MYMRFKIKALFLFAICGSIFSCQQPASKTADEPVAKMNEVEKANVIPVVQTTDTTVLLKQNASRKPICCKGVPSRRKFAMQKQVANK
jgi:hypothetical protein